VRLQFVNAGRSSVVHGRQLRADGLASSVTTRHNRRTTNERFAVRVGTARRISFSLSRNGRRAKLIAVKIAPGMQAPAPNKTVTPASRAGWASGVSLAGGTPAAEAFARYRGAQVSVVNTFQPRTSWQDIATDTWAIDQYDGFNGQVVFSLPLVPDGDATDLPAVAAGQRNQYFEQFARNLVAAGRGSSIVRLGWEFNVPGWSWSANNAAVWVAAFRQIVTALHAVAPSLAIDWCGNYGRDQTGHSAFGQLYPGDAYVDIVGVDTYNNQWSPVDDESQWQTYLNAPGGLNDWLAFAKQHGKPLSVPEWGLYNSGGGDNAYFIAKMHSFFAANTSEIAYECYFNVADSYIQSSLSGPDQNPAAAASYRALWSTTS
jgi:hypothetical protein